jgi:excisionase family DNA binding protein
VFGDGPVYRVLHGGHEACFWWQTMHWPSRVVSSHWSTLLLVAAVLTVTGAKVPRQFITLDEAAAWLGVSTATVRRRIGRGVLRGYRFPGSRLIFIRVVDHVLVDHTLRDTLEEQADQVRDRIADLLVRARDHNDRGCYVDAERLRPTWGLLSGLHAWAVDPAKPYRQRSGDRWPAELAVLEYEAGTATGQARELVPDPDDRVRRLRGELVAVDRLEVVVDGPVG